MNGSISFLKNEVETQEKRKIGRNVTDLLRIADSIALSAKSCSILFNDEAIATRMKLRDFCVRHIVKEYDSSQRPSLEEILWRKVYYDPISQSKKLRKQSGWSEQDGTMVGNHISEAISCYQNLLMIFQESDEGAYEIDFGTIPNYSVDPDLLRETTSISSESFYRCYTYLGDLTRYILDLPEYVSGDSSLLCLRYYHQALHFNPESGLTHCNLATVYSNTNELLLAVLHYLRGVTSNKPFEAAELHLLQLLKKSKSLLDTNKSEDNNADVNKKSETFLHTCLWLVNCLTTGHETETVPSLCQQVLVEMGDLLDNYDNKFLSPTLSELDGTSKKLDVNPSSNSFVLNPENMVILCGVFILTAKHLQLRESAYTNMAEVLLVCILHTLMTHINTRLEQRFSSIDPDFVERLLPTKTEVPPVERKNEEESEHVDNASSKQKKSKSKLAALRRRRVRYGNDGSDADSSFSDSDISDCEDLSEDEENFDPVITPNLCSSDDDSDLDVKIESDQEWNGLSSKEHLELIGKEGMVASVYIILDWFLSNDIITKQFAEQDENTWPTLAKFFNLIKVDPEGLIEDVVQVPEDLLNELKVGVEVLENNGFESTITLPEDYILHFVLPSFKIKNTMESSSIKMNVERLQRIKRLLRKYLSKGNAPLVVEQGKLEYKKIPKPEKLNHLQDNSDMADGSKKKLKSKDSTKLVVTAGMRSLASQWISYEVRNLESQTQAGGLYLVPDTNVFLNNLGMLKKMLKSQSHLIIVPFTVMESLDLLKKESAAARNASRWLDVVLRPNGGSRFVRAQRPHEKTRLPYIKYPKKKDKLAIHWFAVIECCNYLGRTHSKTDPSLKKSTVTLLTSLSKESISQLPVPLETLSVSAGCVLQNVDDFIKKWQLSIGP